MSTAPAGSGLALFGRHLDLLRSHQGGRGITIFGDGGQSRDFIFVGDVVRALLAAMEHATTGAQVHNVCTGRPTTIREMAAAIADTLAITPEISYAPPRQGDIRVSCGDPSGARAALGFAARTGFADGLARTLLASSHPGSVTGQPIAGDSRSMDSRSTDSRSTDRELDVGMTAQWHERRSRRGLPRGLSRGLSKGDCW